MFRFPHLHAPLHTKVCAFMFVREQDKSKMFWLVRVAQANSCSGLNSQEIHKRGVGLTGPLVGRSEDESDHYFDHGEGAR